MGTINYGRNKVFCVGLDIYSDWYDNLEEIEQEEYVEDMLFETKTILEKYSFEYFKVKIEYGYYDGFYLDIEDEYAWFNTYEDKLNAIKELSNIKRLIVELLELGLVNYIAGWCTTIYEYKEHKKEILKELNESIKEQKELVKKQYTDKTLSYKDNMQKFFNWGN